MQFRESSSCYIFLLTRSSTVRFISEGLPKLRRSLILGRRVSNTAITMAVLGGVASLGFVGRAIAELQFAKGVFERLVGQNIVFR